MSGGTVKQAVGCMSLRREFWVERMAGGSVGGDAIRKWNQPEQRVEQEKGAQERILVNSNILSKCLILRVAPHW